MHSAVSLLAEGLSLTSSCSHANIVYATAICTCAGDSSDPVSDFSVGVRPQLATLTATSAVSEQDGSQTIECEWHFQTLQGDEENDCQQEQRRLLSRGSSRITQLLLQVAIDAAALSSMFKKGDRAL